MVVLGYHSKKVMSTELTDSLNRILNWIKRHEPQYVNYLYPGLSKDEIDNLIKDFPITFCPELYELYQWRNGARLGDLGKETAWLFENWTFMPLQEIVARYQTNLIKKQFRINYPIKNIPYLQNFQRIEIFAGVTWRKSGYVFIKNNLDFCPVIFEEFEEGELSILKKYSSLTNMMLTIAECYETGTYLMEPGVWNRFIIINDPEKEHQIWRKYNSKIIKFALQSIEKFALCGQFFLCFSNDLIEFKDPKTVEPLIQELQRLNNHNDDWSIAFRNDPFLYFDPKQEVARILGELGDTRAVPVLIDTFKDNNHNNWDYQTKVSAAKALGQLKDERATEPLIEALMTIWSNSNSETQKIGELGLEEIRQMAAWALGEIGDIRAVKPLIEALRDSESNIRITAVKALTKLILKFPNLEGRIPF